MVTSLASLLPGVHNIHLLWDLSGLQTLKRLSLEYADSKFPTRALRKKHVFDYSQPWNPTLRAHLCLAGRKQVIRNHRKERGDWMACLEVCKLRYFSEEHSSTFSLPRLLQHLNLHSSPNEAAFLSILAKKPISLSLSIYPFICLSRHSW